MLIYKATVPGKADSGGSELLHIPRVVDLHSFIGRIIFRTLKFLHELAGGRVHTDEIKRSNLQGTAKP